MIDDDETEAKKRAAAEPAPRPGSGMSNFEERVLAIQESMDTPLFQFAKRIYNMALENVAASIEIQRNDIAATGSEFAAVVRKMKVPE